MVAGGMEIWTGHGEKRFQQWLRDQANSVRRLCSVCTGAFILAEAGLLDGKRATTHWYFSSRLQKQYPRLKVGPDRIYVQDGKVYTSAGVSAGIDLALTLVEEDLGSEIALRVARGLVVYLRRTENQSQLSTALAFQKTNRIHIREMPIWILENLSMALTVEHLAQRSAMSTRNFSRVFTDEYGVTPARFVEKLRVETAMNLLHDSDKSVQQIALECGFGSAITMRRALKRERKPLPSRLREGV
jgi:transcriptional regulator GlxA family with amidase domain